jgi:phosphate ABC transporter phosphate-binding protein
VKSYEATVTRSLHPARAVGLCFVCGLLLLLAPQFCIAADAPSVTSLSQVKTLYVESFSGGSDAELLRTSLVRRLAKDRRFNLVQSAKGADAVVNGTGQIWVRGFITINPRNPSTDRQPVYGGYLSLEVVGGDGQPLWSWLVSPGRLTWSNIVDELAGRAADKMIEAGKAAPVTVSATSTSAHPQTTLTGGGATFPAPLYKKWFQVFEELHPGMYLQYSPTGSQSGLESLVAGKLDFAGSDVAPAVAVGAADAANLRRFATVLGAVVPIYNVKGVTQDLRFTPEALAEIYLGRVRRWNDPEIRRSNKGVNLPDDEIVVVHRSDGSGTTWVWSDYLSKVSSTWSSSVGRGTTLHWPVGTGAEHNEGVAEAVKHTPNSIGYVELVYAIQHDLSFGAVRNRAGEYVRADLDSLAEAAKVPGANGEPPPSITNAVGKYAYPISTFTWIVVPARLADATKRAATTELLRWMLTSGQKECSALAYAPLPRDVTDAQLRLLGVNP